jgi:GDP-L-fucose synthase
VNPSDKIYVAGHTGLVGSALVRALERAGYSNLVLRTRAELDLLNQARVAQFFETERPQYVFLAAGKTGGVYANSNYRAEFLYENIVIQSNVIHASFEFEAKKLLFLGCSSMYPKHCPQPIREEYLLTAPLEPTNEPFAVAKLAGVKMCESYARQYGCDFISVIPANLYGQNQDYTPLNSLIIPALIRRFHEAKEAREPFVKVWGSGRPSRDFLFVDDLAEACLFLMDHYSEAEPINVGSGTDITVREAAEVIRSVTEYPGEIRFDTSMPDGVLSKLQDISKLAALGWKPRVRFEDGIRIAYSDFLRHVQA